MKFLIIGERSDDCDHIIRTLQPVYRDVQFAVVSAAHSLSSALDTDDLALVLTNYGIDGISGSALLRTVRERHPVLPVIVVTAALDVPIGQALLEQGVADVVLMQQVYRLPGAVRATLNAALTNTPSSTTGMQIDELKAALQHEEHFRALFEDAPIGIAIARAGITVSANRAYLRMFGYASLADMLGTPLLNHIAPREQPLIAERIRQREQSVAVPNDYETIGQRQDGSEFPFHVEVVRVTFSSGPVSVAFCTDITARRQAEDRLHFLTKASALLAASLDYEVTMEHVAQLVVPQLADWCGVDMLAEDGTLERVAVAHVDPAKVELAREAQRRYPPDPTRPNPSLRVLQSGQSEFIADISDTLLEQVAQDADHLALMRALGLRSVLYVPLTGRARVLGVITLITAESGRRYSAQDVPFVEELARRAALAIDNARLYHLAHEQRERLQVTLASIGDGVIATDIDGRVTLINGVAETLTGWTADAAIGQPLEQIFVIINEQTRHPVESPATKVLRENTVVGLANHTVLITKDGREIPIDDSGAPIRAADGQLLGVVLVFHDVAKQRYSEAVLREQEALFRTMADSAPVLIWVADIDKRCTFFNQPWLTFTGRTMEQEFGYGWAEGVHPDDFARCLDIYVTAFDARQAFTMDYRLRRADGVYRWVVDNGRPRWTPEDDFTGYIGSCVDITERKDAEERQRFLAEASPVLSASLDYTTTLAQVAKLFVPRIADYCLLYSVESDGHYHQAAAAHRDSDKQVLLDELAGLYQPKALGSNSLLGQVQATGQGLVEPHASLDTAASVLTDPAVFRIYSLLNPVSYMIVPLIARGQQLGALTVAAAESGRYYMTEDLAFVTDLASRCALAIDNARLYAQAQDAITQRDQFVSIASHELKTPLTSMLGYTRLLQRRNAREQLLGERDTRALQVISKQGERLNSLLSLLLDLSRIETGQLRIEPVPFDLRTLVQRLVEDIQPTLDHHNIAFGASETPLMVIGDEGRLEQVIQNIISNATKYSPNGGMVAITVEQRGMQACVVVQDEGIGIPAEALPRLGERFFRASNVNPQHISGTGIGLYVTKEIMQLHSGTLDVESVEGAGTTITIGLPLETPGVDTSSRSAA